jgi:hypothetical protein
MAGTDPFGRDSNTGAKKKRPAEAGRRGCKLRFRYGFFLAAGFFVDEVLVDAVLVVDVVSDFVVLEVSVAADVVVAEPIAPVSVAELIAPEVPLVVDVSEAELVVAAPVSAAVVVAPVSVLAFSSFLQPTAKIATAKRATRVTMRDFFISILSFVLFRSF